jgi:hypothetical protein
MTTKATGRYEGDMLIKAPGIIRAAKAAGIPADVALAALVDAIATGKVIPRTDRTDAAFEIVGVPHSRMITYLPFAEWYEG